MAKSAPGKHNRMGLARTARFEPFQTDAAAKAWFADKHWDGTPTFPHCRCDNVQTGIAYKTTPYRCRAKDCLKRFNTKTGTEQQMEAMVGDMVGKRLRYDDLVAAGPVGTVAEPDSSEPWSTT